MERARTAPWVAGAVLLGLLIMLGAWLLAVSPKLDSVAEKQEQTEFEQSRIDQLQIQLTGLKKDFENIDELRAGLDQIVTQIPADLELSNLTRQVFDLATQSQVFVVALNPGVPTAIVPPVPEPTDPQPADGAEDTEAESPAPADDSAAGTNAATPPPAEPTLQGFYAVPMELTVQGSFDKTVSFLGLLQTANPRLVLVSSLSVTGQEARGAEGGRPEVAEGDIETVITAYAYVLRDPKAGQAAAAGADGVDAPTVEAPPAAGTAGNPFGATQ